MKVLVIPPHYDDEVMLCGGSISKWVRQKHEVTVRFWEMCNADESPRQEEAQKILNYCSSVSNIPLVVEDLVDDICKYQPKIIITSHPNDFHAKHAEIGKAVQQAVYYVSRKISWDKIEGYDTPMLLFGTTADIPLGFKPQVYSEFEMIDIQHKMLALQKYDWFSQAPRSKYRDMVHDVVWLFRQAEDFGDVAGCKLAEFFEIGNPEPIMKI